MSGKKGSTWGKYSSINERFEAKFSKGDGCWEWAHVSAGDDGYGRFNTGEKVDKAHRVSWTLYVGPVPDGMFVLHKCDNRKCVNPDHLFLGDNAANMADMKAKGRGRGLRGENHKMAKLTDQQAKKVLEKALSGENQKQIAREFNISHQLVSAIKTGVCRSHSVNV
jgi:hypothetical protein